MARQLITGFVLIVALLLPALLSAQAYDTDGFDSTNAFDTDAFDFGAGGGSSSLNDKTGVSLDGVSIGF